MATDDPGPRRDGAAVLVAVGRDLYQVPDTCPHAGAPLAEAEQHGPFIRCIWHGATFDVRDGRWLRGPRCPDISTRLVGSSDGSPEPEGSPPCRS